MIDILCFLLPIGIFSRCLLGIEYAKYVFSSVYLSLLCSCLLILVLKSCIYYKYVLRPILHKCVEICMC